jgi:hypothetical protein
VICGTEGNEPVRPTPTEWKPLEILVKSSGKLLTEPPCMGYRLYLNDGEQPTEA